LGGSEAARRRTETHAPHGPIAGRRDGEERDLMEGVARGDEVGGKSAESHRPPPSGRLQNTASWPAPASRPNPKIMAPMVPSRSSAIPRAESIDTLPGPRTAMASATTARVATYS